jgi:hypothetical protein
MRSTVIAFSAGLALLLAAPALAHHPFAAEFDWKKPVTLIGTVTKLDWTNPHSYLYVDAKDSSGKKMNWKIEMGGPTSLSRLGWTRDELKPGDMIVVDAWQARNGNRLVSAKSIRFSDGRELFAASSFFESQRQQGAQRASSEKPGQQKAVGTSGNSTSKPTGTTGKRKY